MAERQADRTWRMLMLRKKDVPPNGLTGKVRRSKLWVDACVWGPEPMRVPPLSTNQLRGQTPADQGDRGPPRFIISH